MAAQKRKLDEADATIKCAKVANDEQNSDFVQFIARSVSLTMNYNSLIKERDTPDIER